MTTTNTMSASTRPRRIAARLDLARQIACIAGFWLCSGWASATSAIEVTHVPVTLPALQAAPRAALLQLNVEVSPEQAGLQLTELTASLQLDDDADVQAIEVFAGERAPKADSPALCRVVRPQAGWQQLGEQIKLSISSAKLQAGKHQIWVTCQVAANANLDHQIGIRIHQVTTSDGTRHALPNALSMQRLGVSLRAHGDDGVHTYRIPGLATTNRGTLLAVYDIRHRSGRDLPGDIDVGLSRSVDGGQSWQPMRTIMDMGDDAKWSHDGIGDPAILVDRQTGTIWVAAVWSHGKRGWHGSGPGLEPTETGQLVLVRSDDDGQTWSAPINITQSVKRPEWCFLLQGPGKGITTSDGTLIFAAQYQDPAEKKRLPHSTILYSRDHGRTWQIGSPAWDDTTEAQVVELASGQLMLNCRYNRASSRIVVTSSDLGRTWTTHASSQKSLIEPRACMASLINVGAETTGTPSDWLLFSNPNSTARRERITIKGSPDSGTSWPADYQILLDQGRGAGYSCMSMIDEQTVGILYEGSQAQLTFQRVKLPWLGKKQPE